MKRHFLRILVLLMFNTVIFISTTIYAAQENTTILILPFQIKGSSKLDYLNTEIPILLSQSITNKGFSVIPDETVQSSLEKQKISQINLSTAKQLARQAHAAYAIYGEFSQKGESIVINARLVKASDAQPAKSFLIKKKGLIQLQSAIEELTTKINSTISKKDVITNITIQGLKILDPDIIITRLSIHKGDPIAPTKIDEELKRIWSLGYFSNVSAHLERNNNGQTLIFTVVEKPKITDVVINGSKAVSKDNILAAMGSKKGSVINDKTLSQDIQKIMELYRKEGYYLVDVKYEIQEKADPGVAELIFNIHEGKKLYIKEVRIEGLETINPRKIKRELALSKRNILSWFTGTGVLREEYLERDSIAISAYAMNHGYIDVQVAAPEITHDDKGIIVTFKVKEGKRYKIGHVGFKGDLIETKQQLLDVIKLDEHKEYEKFFSLSVMQDDIKTLTDFYSDYGYAFAEVDLETNKHDETALIDVIFVIDKKQKVFIRRVGVEGNVRTRDNVIFRELRLADGDPFNGAKLRRSNERLHRLRYFSQADTEILPTGSDDEIDLLINVKEERTGSLSGGVGYSTYSKFGVSGSIMERNLWGKGYLIGLEGFISSVTASLDLSFINPRIFDTNLGFSNNIYAVRDEWDDFRKKTYGDTIRLFHPIGEYTSVFIGYRLDRYTLYDIPETAPRSYLDYEGKNTSSVISSGFTYDSTDSRDRPSRGYIAKLTAEYGGGGLGGNDNFFKPIVELQGFHTILRNKNYIFHWRARAGAAYKNDKKPVPVFNRFFIGGIDSIRGYDTEDLAPKDPRYKDEIGGDRMAFLNLEYIWTFQPDLGLALVPFFDIGFQVDSAQTSKPFSKLKRSFGLELRWRSPMGDLRFAYGIPLNKNVNGEKTHGRFEFSMGQFF